MYVFKVKKGSTKFYRVNEASIIEATKRQYPFYQTVNDEKRHYAYCPACENPVILINVHVDGKTTDDDDQKTLKMHARHTRYDVAGIGAFNQTAYDGCPYANPYSSSTKTRRDEGKTTDELLWLVKTYPDVLDIVMRRDVGIGASEELFEKMLKNFKEERGHLYRYVNKHNLPYAFMYMADNQSLMYQKTDLSYKAGLELKNLISDGAKWCYVSKYGKILKKADVDGYVDLRFYFTDFEVEEIDGEKYQKFSLVITEQLKKKIEGKFQTEDNEVVRKDIRFDQYYYQYTVDKRLRYAGIVETVYGR